MNPIQYRIVCLAALASFAFLTPQATADESFRTSTGLQLWSLRDQLKADVAGTLDSVKTFGFATVETAGTNSLSAEEFYKLLEARNLKAVSGHFPYGAFEKDISAVIKDAKALGLTYVVCPWIPHEPAAFTEEDVRRAASNFNLWGDELKQAGLHFAYHVHGYEFRPSETGGTLFDALAKATKPQFVGFEMDVFWVVQPGADPVDLLTRYPGRWQLMHLKDIRKGSPIGIYTGKAPKTDDVTLGTGQVNWPSVLAAAEKSGVKHYFIEDESPTVTEQIPDSLKFLETIPKK